MPAGGILFVIHKKNQKVTLRETAFLLKISSFYFSFEAKIRIFFRLPPEFAWF